MKDSVSPEEKLFKIIQQEKGPSSGPGKDGRKKDPALWLKNAALVFSSLKDKAVSVVKSASKGVGGALPGKMPEIKLEAVNITLSTVLSVIILFVAYYAVAKYPNIAKITSAAARAQMAAPNVPYKEAEAMQPVEYYTEGPRRRNIFTSVQKSAATVERTAVMEGGKSGGGDLKLQGIAWSDIPKVIMQSGKENNIYILKEGQAVGTTGKKVKKILRNKVVLTDGESDFELL